MPGVTLAHRAGSRQPWPPVPGPWLSPQVVTRNRWPKLLYRHCGLTSLGPFRTGDAVLPSRGFALRSAALGTSYADATSGWSDRRADLRLHILLNPLNLNRLTPAEGRLTDITPPFALSPQKEDAMKYLAFAAGVLTATRSDLPRRLN